RTWRCRQGRWKSKLEKGWCGLLARSMCKRYVRCWSAWQDDRAAGRNAHLDRSRSYRSAARFYRVERDGAERTQGKSILGSRVRVSWSSWGSDQAAVVVGRWPVLIRKEIGTRKIHLAASNEWNGIAQPGTAFDVARGD